MSLSSSAQARPSTASPSARISTAPWWSSRPERAIEIQALLGADIAMQLDECLRLPADARRDRARDAVVAALGASAASAPSRAERARAMPCSASCRAATTWRCAARAPANSSTSDFHGYAIGGLAVGEPQEVMLKIVEETAPLLPAGAAALSDGRRHAARSAGGGCARHRHVRLRAADAQRPPRHGLHALRRDQSRQCAPRRRRRARSTRKARIRPRAPIRAPICIT